MKRKIAVPLILILIMAGCAGQKLTVHETQRATADISMSAWDREADQIQLAYLDPATDAASKTLIKEQIKPKMLQLHDLISSYTKLIIAYQENKGDLAGAAQLRSDAVALLNNIRSLFSKVQKEKVKPS